MNVGMEKKRNGAKEITFGGAGRWRRSK